MEREESKKTCFWAELVGKDSFMDLDEKSGGKAHLQEIISISSFGNTEFKMSMGGF